MTLAQHWGFLFSFSVGRWGVPVKIEDLKEQLIILPHARQFTTPNLDVTFSEKPLTLWLSTKSWKTAEKQNFQTLIILLRNSLFFTGKTFSLY